MLNLLILSVGCAATAYLATALALVIITAAAGYEIDEIAENDDLMMRMEWLCRSVPAFTFVFLLSRGLAV